MKNERVSQAPEGFDPKKVALVAVVAIAIGLGAVAVAWWLTPRSRLVTDPAAVDPEGAVAGVEVGPIRGVSHGQRLTARARANIQRFGWADRDAGLARIPIDRAMEMIARGCRPPGAGPTGFELSVDPACSTPLPPASVANELPPRSTQGRVPLAPLRRAEPLRELRAPERRTAEEER